MGKPKGRYGREHMSQSLGSERVSIETDRLRDEPNHEGRRLICEEDINVKRSTPNAQRPTLNVQSEIRRGERPTPKFRIRKRNIESGTQESGRHCEIEGKVTTVAASERGHRASFKKALGTAPFDLLIQRR